MPLPTPAPDFTALRHAMVEGQLRPNKVIEPRLLAAFEALAREDFAAEPARAHAYDDTPLPLDVPGRAGFSPLVAGVLAQALGVNAMSRVLVVGAGTGYEALLLAHLAGHVVALEDTPTLAAKATQLAVAARMENVTVVQGPLAEGYAPGAPYDAMLVVPPFAMELAALKAQLKDGGKLAGIRAGAGLAMGHVCVGTRYGTTFVAETLMETGATAYALLQEDIKFVF